MGSAAVTTSESRDEATLWQRVRVQGDAAARTALLNLHLPYAKTLAATYYGRRYHDEVGFDEYLQLARLGMLEAFERYDPQGGAQFRTYAARCMHGALMDGLMRSSERQQQMVARKRLLSERTRSLKNLHPCGATGNEADGAAEPLSMPAGAGDVFRVLTEVGVGLALGFMLEDTGMVCAGADAASGADAYRAVELQQARRRLHELVDQLPTGHRDVVRMHYLQGMAFIDIGGVMSLTKGRISQIHKEALQTLRTLMSTTCDVSF